MRKALFFGFLLVTLAAYSQQDTTRVNELDAVVVTGQIHPQSMRQSVYRIRTISQERIRLRAATDIAGILNNEPGIRFSTDFALGETDISLMGMGGQNVKILLDGVPLVDRGSTRQSLNQVDVNTVERIEIVEGPMSVVYGSDALAGVINIITKKSKAASRLSIGARVQEETVGKEYAAFSGEGIHNEHLNVAWQKKGWYSSASITRNNMGGWQGNKTGREKEWRPKDQWLPAASLGFRNEAIDLSYRLNYLNEIITIPGAVNPGNKATDQEYITDRYTHLLNSNWRINPGFSLNSALSYQDYQRRTRTTDIDLNTGRKTLNINLSGGQDVSIFTSWFFRSTGQWILNEKLSLQPGIEIKNDYSEGERMKGKPSITDYAAFISGEWKPLTWLNFRPGLRFIANSKYDAPPVIPSVNARLKLAKDWDLRVSYARGFRAPALRELYFDFHDANHDINGNENLKAEYSNSFTGSMNWEKTLVSDLTVKSSMSGFYSIYRDQITTALSNDPSSPNLSVYVNIDKFKTTGGSWENSVAWKNLYANVSFFYIGRYNRYTDMTDYREADLPTFVWSPELSANLTYLLKPTQTSFALFYKYTGKTPVYQLIVLNGQQKLQLAETASFHFADFTISQRAGKYLSINTGVKNIFDVTRLQNSSVADGVHTSGGPVLKATGRSYFLGLAFQL